MYASRDLFASGYAEQDCCPHGSMGHAAALGLGPASARKPEDPVVVPGGDGAELPNLGTLSTLRSARPVPLVHLVFEARALEVGA
ncbi:thiamine pyrophosphate-dependent enzyme [Micromonospora sp. NPDC047074]|uniref:thiamine pyrophosphate-dependent enzyme n=1 Tax=Micromonospora sp. NPDC047074 TaxID=3154339 RepID=UPI00340845F9